MATVLEIIQGINQAAANAAWDGAHEESLQADGKARSAGLQRENGHYIHDRRVMDGFNVKFHGPVLRLTYQAETRIKEVKANGFEHHILVQRMSNYRTDVQAHCDYVIGGLKDVVEVNEGSDDDRLDSAIKDWLALGPKNKRPKNDTRKGK